jgi:hypothetical protein
MTTFLSILAAAMLFATFGMVFGMLRAGCGSCDGKRCGSCRHEEERHG